MMIRRERITNCKDLSNARKKPTVPQSGQAATKNENRRELVLLASAVVNILALAPSA